MLDKLIIPYCYLNTRSIQIMLYIFSYKFKLFLTSLHWISSSLTLCAQYNLFIDTW